ncbi:hypothetical protein [Caballeronia grimmiae]|uniref:hypothetical protein n=1 Tax=Caballeronia grimmiae TaxID=1071679 RepID=UPI0038BB9FF6
MLDALNSAAIDCQNDGAMSARAVTTSNAAAALTKPRRIPGLVRNPRRALDIRFVQECEENMLAVAMVCDVLYWTTPDPTEDGAIHTKIEFDGFRWAARSTSYWMAHLNIKSVQKVRTAVKVMLASKLVECEERFFNGNMWPHYRLSDKALAMIAGDQVDVREPNTVKGGVSSNTPLLKTTGLLHTELKQKKSKP